MALTSARSSAGLGAALVALLAPASARAAVDIGPERIVVTGSGTSATIVRDPVRISFAGADGRVVLAQVPNPDAAPFPVLPVPGPVPLGLDAVRRPALYAPLSFTVGTEQAVQVPATQFAGNLLTGAGTGVTYSARRVTAAVPDGDGVRLTLATSDPTGRTLTATVAPGPAGTMRLRAVPSDPAGVSLMADSFAAAPTDTFRGFGGRHNALDQRGEDLLNYDQQENVGGGLAAAAPGQPSVAGVDDRLLFPNGRTAAYYVQSSFVSSGGYGFLLDRDEISRWRMGSDRPDAWQTEVAAPALDYLVAPGDAPPAIATLTSITGRHRVPPAWAVEPSFDRAVRYPGDTAAGYARDVQADLQDVKRYDLPLGSYRIEGWEFYARDELRRVIAQVRAQGLVPLLYFRAFVGQDTIGTDRPSAYDEALREGYVATRADGSPYEFLSNFQARGALIDFTDPRAVRWWQGRIREALELGADGFMEDFGEQTQTDMHFDDGSTGAQMHNRYGVLYHRATREELDRWQAAHPERREPFFFTRTGYSGTPGSAAYENANFAGDGTTDFSASSGLAAQTPDMLNRQIGGLYGFTTDIGGYFDVGPYRPTTKELFLRWAAWAALSPFFRLHGSVLAGTHTPWSYDAETVALYNAFSRLHEAAAPLILREWRAAVRTGMPPLRPLWLAFPGDATAAEQEQEWLLGDDVLVAPVVTQGAAGRDVYFPAGCWSSPESGLQVQGPRTQRVLADLSELPYFFRCGTSPFTAAGAGAAALPSPAARCTSRRRFTIRLREPRGGGDRLASATVYVDGRRVARVVRRGTRRLRTRIDLRGLPRRRVQVRVVSRTTRGRTFVERRSYRTCTSRGTTR